MPEPHVLVTSNSGGRSSTSTHKSPDCQYVRQAGTVSHKPVSVLPAELRDEDARCSGPRCRAAFELHDRFR